MGEQFYNAHVYFGSHPAAVQHSSGFPFQRTPTGVRDVRRVLVMKPGTNTVLPVCGSPGKYGVANSTGVSGAVERSALVPTESVVRSRPIKAKPFKGASARGMCAGNTNITDWLSSWLACGVHNRSSAE